MAKKDLELVKLWESMLTGRVAPLPAIIKENFSLLALNHIFTPSGFHLSAIMGPMLRLIKFKPAQFFIILSVGVVFIFIPGFLALKRMIFIKASQTILDLKMGFCLALLVDALVGTFQSGALSFTYSFLFLGLIYSGIKGVALLIWFFVAQILISFFNSQDISLLLLIFLPLINALFALALPLLFLLCWPLLEWQLSIGLFILRMLKDVVEQIVVLVKIFPSFEIHIVTLIMIALILIKRWKISLILLVVFSRSLNLDRARFPSMPKHEYVALEMNHSCRVKLVRGIWWKACSPSRKSRR